MRRACSLRIDSGLWAMLVARPGSENGRGVTAVTMRHHVIPPIDLAIRFYLNWRLRRKAMSAYVITPMDALSVGA